MYPLIGIKHRVLSASDPEIVEVGKRLSELHSRFFSSLGAQSKVIVIEFSGTTEPRSKIKNDVTYAELGMRLRKKVRVALRNLTPFSAYCWEPCPPKGTEAQIRLFVKGCMVKNPSVFYNQIRAVVKLQE